MQQVLDKIDASHLPFLVPVTNGFHVFPFPGLDITSAEAIRMGFLPKDWSIVKPLFVARSKVVQYLKDNECLAYPSGWDHKLFVSEEFRGLRPKQGIACMLCIEHYKSKALQKLRSMNSVRESSAKATTKLLELYCDFLKSSYGEGPVSAVVSVIRKHGASYASPDIVANGWESYESWLIRVMGSKRTDPDKARDLRLLARGRRV